MTIHKSDCLLSLSVVLLLLLAGVNGWLQDLDDWAYDHSQSLLQIKPGKPEVVVVGIDDAAIQAVGAWPWSRDVWLRVQARLATARPRLVVYHLPFDHAENQQSLQVLSELRAALPAHEGVPEQDVLQAALDRLDVDTRLAREFSVAGNVLLALPWQEAATQPLPLASLPDVLRPQTLPAGQLLPAEQFSRWPAWLRPARQTYVQQLLMPTRTLAAGASGLVVNAIAMNGNDARRVPLLLPYGDAWLPSLPLAIVARLQALNMADIRFTDTGVALGATAYPTDNAWQVYPYFYPAAQLPAAIPHYSLADLLAADFDIKRLRGQVVMIGLTAPGQTRLLSTPTAQLPDVVVSAEQTANLLAGQLFHVSETGWALRYLALALVILYLLLLAPRLSWATGVSLGLLLLATLAIAQASFMLLRNEWLPLMLPFTALLLGQSLLLVKIGLLSPVSKAQRQLQESNRLLGQSLQSQGQLDQAFARYQRAGSDEDTLGLCYSLGLDFERKRQFNKALEVFKYLQTQRRQYRDLAARISKNSELSGAVPLGKDSQPGTRTLVLSDQGVQKPVLGRYEVERELGRGAMGMVYLGRDPRIGRTVAIKTMSFAPELADDGDMADIKERFFREAEAAGRLRHLNIVTIYDVGEEQDLCYIAMDYLPGRDLSYYTGRERRLPISEVIDIGLQVATALHYAHQNNVVHRDIKPGNIIYAPEQQRATVTDFGVASLTDVSNTRTGTILGSPAYMAPEQLAGHKVDGSADLYSLGVTLFQLLAAELPFKGDSLSNLMYNITHQNPPELRKLRPEVPTGLATIIKRCLQKDSAKRYANGEQLAEALRRCQQRQAVAE